MLVSDLVQVRRHEVVAGIPLPWAIYDQESRLILSEGQIIETEAQVDELMGKIAYRAAANRAREGERANPRPRDGRRPDTLSFESMRLRVGDAIQLQPSSGKERYYTRLIGYAEGRSVLVTTPQVDGCVLLLREGQGFVARAFSGKNAFAFDAVVTRVCNSPFPYLHLEFPKRVQTVAIRRDARVQLRVIAAVTPVADGGEPLPALITDLSASGARLESPQRLGKKGDMLQVAFRIQFDEDEAYFVLEGTVRSVREEPNRGCDALFVSGVEFTGMQQNDKLLLKALLFQRMAEGRGAIES